MNKILRIAKRLSLLAFLLIGIISPKPLLFAQKGVAGTDIFVPSQRGTDTLFYVGVIGDIYYSTTSNIGRTHVLGSFKISNADYSRGAFDGIPEELKSLAYSPTLATVIQIIKTNNFLKRLTTTIGSQLGLTNRKFGDTTQIKPWYEANYYGGLVVVIPNFAAGVTYVIGTSPNIGTQSQEIDYGLEYVNDNVIGQLRPTIVLTVPIAASGFLIQLSGNPNFAFFKKSNLPLTISLPIRLGAGLANYRVKGSSGYISLGIGSQLTIKKIPTTFGSWNITLGVDFLGRDKKLANINPQFDKGGRFLILGGVGFIFLY